jgi:hypothetical protein
VGPKDSPHRLPGRPPPSHGLGTSVRLHLPLVLLKHPYFFQGYYSHKQQRDLQPSSSEVQALFFASLRFPLVLYDLIDEEGRCLVSRNTG